MNRERETLNYFLVEVFHEILKHEESWLARGAFENLSVREMHVIEAVCAGEAAGENTAAEIAARLHITAGTLTTAVNNLENKGYLKRKRDQLDKRRIRVEATAPGRRANELHWRFHEEMIESILSRLSPEEMPVFIKGLEIINSFFKEKYTPKGKRK